MNTLRRVTPTVVMALMLAMTAVLFRPGLHGELVLDDLPNLQPFWDLASGAMTWRQVLGENISGPTGRPLAMLSFVADFYIGGGAFWQFKFTNLLIHLLCGVLLFQLAGRLLRRLEPFRAPEIPWWIALFVATYWLTAPLFASTVLYVIQRMAMLVALFSLAGLLAYVVGREQIDVHFRKGCLLILSCPLIATPLAVLSKENGVLLPLLALVVEVFWFGFRGTRRTRFALGALFGLSVGVPVVVGLVALILNVHWLLDGYASRDFTLTERLLTETRILWNYLGQLFLPRGLALGLFHDDYVISKGILSPPNTLLACLVWALLLIALFRWGKIQSVRLLGFGVTFFLAGHLLESTVWPLELYFEHRNYLPATGLLIGVVGAVAVELQRRQRLRRVAASFLLLPMLNAFITYQQVMTWQSAESIARMSAHVHSRSPRLQTGLIAMYIRDGDIEKAREHIRAHAELTGGYGAAHAMHEIAAFCQVRVAPPAEALAQVATKTRLEFSIYTDERVSNLADLFQNGQCPSVDARDLLGFFHAIANQLPEDGQWLLHFHLARLLYIAGDHALAIRLLDDADRMDPARLEAGLVKIRYYLADGDVDAAESTLRDLRTRNQRVLKYQADMMAAIERYLAELRKR